jgi:hypothetical protein
LFDLSKCKRNKPSQIHENQRCQGAKIKSAFTKPTFWDRNFQNSEGNSECLKDNYAPSKAKHRISLPSQDPPVRFCHEHEMSSA